MFKHSATKEIVTERLRLRRFAPGDAPAMFKNWTNDPEVTRYLTWNPHGTIENTEGFLAFLLGKQDNIDDYEWGIEIDGELCGSIAVMNFSEENRSCEMGYCLSRRMWGKGYMTEALRAVIGYLFENTDFTVVKAYHHTDNPASGRVMQKAGMQHTGDSFVFVEKHGCDVPVCNYCISRDDRKGEKQ